jgi:5-methylcytosine-specific restriction endonuclease McrA
MLLSLEELRKEAEKPKRERADYHREYQRKRRAQFTEEQRKQESNRANARYHADPQAANARRRIYREKRKLEIIECMGGCCSECKGVFHHSAYDLHHINIEKDNVDIAYLLNSASWNRVKEELEKCILLCSNCHRALHCAQVDNKQEM